MGVVSLWSEAGYVSTFDRLDIPRIFGDIVSPPTPTYM
jgi:hypothetical protein